MRLVWYIYAQNVIAIITMMNLFAAVAGRVGKYTLTSALCSLVVVSLIALMIWH
ncbi:hypothetical protein ACNKHT_22900 [Shigella flexneri]